MILADYQSKNGPTLPRPLKPVLSGLYGRTAITALDIVVVGASIAGLSCAYSLRQAGHNVRVLEKSLESIESVGAIRIPPNMAKILILWGLGETLAQRGLRCPQIDFLDGKSTELLSSLEFHEKLVRELQADMYGMSYCDLRQMLIELARDSGVVIAFNSEVSDIRSADEEGRSGAVLVTGEVIRADLIVGADGAQSSVRQHLERKDSDEPTQSESGNILIGYMYTVPISEMRNDPDLSPLINSSWKIWLSDSLYAITFTANEDLYAVNICLNGSREPELDWHNVSDLSSRFTQLDSCHISIEKLLRMARGVYRMPQVIQKPVEAFHSKDGHILVVGDAAHSLNPVPVHGASLAIEDAVVLGSLFSRLRSRSVGEMLKLLSAFIEIRQTRWDQVTQIEQQNVLMLTLAEGSQQWVARSALFSTIREKGRVDWDKVDDELVQKSWEELSVVFGYDAYDAADDWWVDWGIIEQRLKRSETISDVGDARSESDASLNEDLTDYGLSRVVVSSSVLA